jgi:hypothetical protein
MYQALMFLSLFHIIQLSALSHCFSEVMSATRLPVICCQQNASHCSSAV